ncbi:MAG: LysR family transcriptional regulator substrate-binding protein, partial [Burkholderiales bacterium]|nr:LysR family transcriptional regulator substrate-binding protein [Burkholderiales bacterium]
EEAVLGVQRAVLCAAPSHPLSKMSAIGRNDLVGQRFVLYESSMSFRWLTDIWFKKFDVSPSVGVESNDTYLLKAMIESGYGIGFLPDWGIQRELDERRLVALAILDEPPQQPLGLLYPSEGLSRVGREFVSFCRTHANLLPRVAHE